MEYSHYLEVRKNFFPRSTSFWLFKGPFGVIVSILIIPVTLIVAIIRWANNRTMSFQAYEDLIDREVETIAQKAFYEFGLVGREEELKTVIIVSPCYSPIRSERVLLRELKKDMVQSTCMEVSVMVLEGLLIRIFTRTFSTVVPLYRDRSKVFFLDNVISLRKTRDFVNTARYNLYTPVFDNSIVIDTAAGQYELKVNGWRQNAGELYMMLQNGFIESKNYESEAEAG